MEQKLVKKKEAGEEPNGSAQYDAKGKLLLPVLENDKMEMKSTEQLKELLDKKDKKSKVDKSSRGNSKQKPKVKETKKADDSFRQKFTSCVLTKVDGVEKVESGDKIVLKFGSNALCRLMNRATHRFTVYKKDDEGKRDTQKICTDEDELKLLQFIKSRVQTLKAKAPKPKVKKAKKPKSNKNAKQPKTVVEKLESAEAKAKECKDSNGFSLKSNKIKVTPEVQSWVAEKGYHLESTSVKF